MKLHLNDSFKNFETFFAEFQKILSSIFCFTSFVLADCHGPVLKKYFTPSDRRNLSSLNSFSTSKKEILNILYKVNDIDTSTVCN